MIRVVSSNDYHEFDKQQSAAGQWIVVQCPLGLSHSMTTPRYTRNHEHARISYEEYIRDKAIDIQSCLEVQRSVRLEAENKVLVTITACGNCLECVRRGIMPSRVITYRD